MPLLICTASPVSGIRIAPHISLSGPEKNAGSPGGKRQRVRVGLEVSGLSRDLDYRVPDYRVVS